ncbi:hypothetical protein ACQZSN_07290 [Clostridioides difficile]
MLKYKEILETIIEILKKNFTESIFIDDESVQGSEGSCFFVSILSVICTPVKYSLQGTTQGRYLTGGVPPVRFSM